MMHIALKMWKVTEGSHLLMSILLVVGTIHRTHFCI